MKKLAILMAFVMAMVMLAACGSDSSPGVGTPAQDKGQPLESSQTKSPSANGLEIVIGCKADTKYGTLDPVREDGGVIKILPLAFEGLVRLAGFGDGGPAVGPCLAESWEISGGGMTYTFKLKPGVKFWDGSPVTPEDWIWSLERARDTADSPWAGYAASIKSVTSPDENTLVIELHEPTASFLSTLVLPSFAVHSKSHADKLGMDAYVKAPMGTGPFYFEEWSPHKYYRLRKNPEYHDELGTNADTLLFNVVEDDNTRIMQLKAGDIDICADLPVNRVAGLHGDDSLAVGLYPSSEQRYINFNVTKTPLESAKVRRALRMATDKDEIIRGVLFGCGENACNVFPDTGFFYSEGITDEGFDIDKAAALLAEAGYPDGFETEISYTESNSVSGEIAALLKKQWAKIGVDLKLTVVEPMAFFEQLDALEHTMTMLRWSDDTNDPAPLADFIGNYDLSHGFHTGYRNPRVTELALEASRTSDAKTRADAYHEIQRILYDESPMFPIYKVMHPVAVRNEVTGFSQNKFGSYDFTDLQKN